MKVEFFIFHSLWTLLLCLTFVSCNKDSNEENVVPTAGAYLYAPTDTYVADQVAKIELKPLHRNGPNSLPSNEYSKLPLTIWIPKGASEPFPLIIYSHGGGSRTNPGESGVEWAKFFSKSGYAVIAMHHMVRSPQDVIQNICGELGIRPVNCESSVYVPYYESTDRPQDAITVMDSLSKIGNLIGYSFDSDKIAITGFSGGTNSTHYLAGGVRNAIFGVSPDTAYFSIHEKRPKAYIAMSPGTGTHGGWTTQSLSDIGSPFLCATGLADLSSEYRAAFYDQMNGSDQYRLYINSLSSKHVTFNHELSGNTQEQEDQKNFLKWLESVNIAFLDSYVKADEKALNWLRSSNLPEIIHESINESESFSTWSYR